MGNEMRPPARGPRISHMATRKSSNSSSKKSGAKKATSAKKSTTAGKTSKRTVIEPHKGDRRYVRRNKKGEFKKEVNVGRSLAADRRRKSKTHVPKGEGDRGETSKPGILARIFG